MEENERAPQMESIDTAGWKRKTALFLSSQNVSMFGSMLVQYAIMWFITLETQSGMVLTLFMLAGFVPQIFISPFAGVWADRYPRKRLIIAADTLTALSTLALAVSFLLGYRELWLIFLVSAIRSVGGGVHSPAVNALLPQIVPTDKLMRVNSINSTLGPVIMILTPVLAGALMAVARMEYIFFIDVVTAAVAVGLLLALKVAPHQRATEAQPAGYLEDLRAGLAYIRGSRAIRALFTFFAFTFFLVTPVAFLTPLLVARSYGEEVWRLTANEVTFFCGSILGGLLMSVWGGFKNRFRTLGLACIVWAALFAALGLTRDFTVYLVIMFLGGLPMPFFNAPVVTLLQELVPGEMQGRVFSVQSLIMNIAMPVGLLLFGPLADTVSIELLLVVSSGLMAIPGIWIFLARQPETHSGETSDSPAHQAAAIPATGAPKDFEMQPGD